VTQDARIVPAGDAALLVELGDRIDIALSARAQALADGVRRAGPFGPPVPAYASVLVPFDPSEISPDEARDILAQLVAGLDDAAEIEPVEGSLVAIPVRYGGEHGPDLAEVGAIHDLRPEQVVEVHASVEYRVHFLGFLPGFAYLGTVPPQIATPRLATPRTAVPAGSVGIAGEQSGIYPLSSPGGWRILGRTDLALWDPARDPPALLEPGMRVRFVPVNRRA
jgi:KipI family sensor histidine kinase inhibitor